MIKIGSNEVSREEFTKWTQALRSGKFMQIRGRLEQNAGFCCLGVACKVLMQTDQLSLTPAGSLTGATPYSQDNSPRWLRDINYDLESKTGIGLLAMNDSMGHSFDEIADVLEAVYLENVLENTNETL